MSADGPLFPEAFRLSFLGCLPRPHFLRLKKGGDKDGSQGPGKEVPNFSPETKLEAGLGWAQ